MRNKYETFGKYTFLFILLILLSYRSICPSERGVRGILSDTTVELVWEQTFGGISHERASMLIQTIDGGFVVFGVVESFGAGYTDLWLVKTDASGQHEWNRTIGAASWDQNAHSILQTADSGFLLAGNTYSYGAGNADYWVVKTNSTGHPIWNSTFGDSQHNLLYASTPSSDGGVLLAGYNDVEESTWIVKANTTGHHLWNRTLAGFTVVNSVIQTLDGGYLFAGETGGYSATDFFMVKTDMDGVYEWNASFGGSEWDVATAVIQLADGSLLLTGPTQSFTGTGNSDYWLIKTNSTGHSLWNTTFGTSKSEEVQTLIHTSDGGFLLAGTRYVSASNHDIWLVKTDTLGQAEWNTTFGGASDDSADSVLQLSDGNYVVAGTTESWGAGASDMWLFKLKLSEDTTTSLPDTSLSTTSASTSTTSADSGSGFSLHLLILGFSFLFLFTRKRRA